MKTATELAAAGDSQQPSRRLARGWAYRFGGGGYPAGPRSGWGSSPSPATAVPPSTSSTSMGTRAACPARTLAADATEELTFNWFDATNPFITTFDPYYSSSKIANFNW